jgi:hypothetical protein
MKLVIVAIVLATGPLLVMRVMQKSSQNEKTPLLRFIPVAGASLRHTAGISAIRRQFGEAESGAISRNSCQE